MKLGISSLGYIVNYGKFHNYSSLMELMIEATRDCLKEAEKYHIEVCEIVLEPPIMLSQENEAIFIELCNSFSIEKQIHAPFIDLSLCSFNNNISQASIDSYIKAIELTKKIGADIITIHPGMANFLIEPLRKINWKIFLENMIYLLDSTKSMDILICLENMPKMLNIFLNVNEFRDFFNKINYNNIFLTYDTSHFWTCGGSISDLWKNLYQRIKNIHLVDNFDKESDKHPQLGSGNIDFDEIFHYLREYQYKDSLIIELSNSEDIPNSISFIQKFL